MYLLMNTISGGQSGFSRLYHYPSLRGHEVKSLFEPLEVHEVAERTLESSFLVGTEHSVSHAAASLMAPELAGHIGHAVGFGLHGVIATAVAAFMTIKARDREEEFRYIHMYHRIYSYSIYSYGR
jgi:hypothetical protein